MDEFFVEFVVRIWCMLLRVGELMKVLVDGFVIKVFVFCGLMYYFLLEEGGIYFVLWSVGWQWELFSWVEYYWFIFLDWFDFWVAVCEVLSDGLLIICEFGDVLMI